MSCFNSNCYLPQPPRAWSRVQNSCSLTTNIENNGLVKLPYSNELVPASTLGERIAMLNKGNVLQYKANSSNLTQAQKYSKIAQGKWTNRNTTWATQSTRGYTNPNTSSLKRSGNVVNIAIDPITGAIIGQTNAPVTCLKPIAPVYESLPSNGGGGGILEPDIPPPVPPTPASETFPPTIPDTPPEPIVIQDEGVLICSIQENVCTGETKNSLSQQLCNPTSDSDVPGTIQLLCWNDGTPTWYPRSRYIMTNSTNKWPVNATLFCSVRPLPPIITSVTSNLNIVTLTWTQSEICLPVSFFNIFQDGILVQTVPGTIFTTDIAVNICKTYEYFIIAVTNGSNISSEPSNTVSILVIIDKSCIYSITGDTTYTDENIGNNYTLTFNPSTTSNSNFTLSFFVNINNVVFTLVGGGGGGRGSGYYPDDKSNFELLVGGVGGGGGSSIETQTNILSVSSFHLVVGKGGAGGLIATPPPEAAPGNQTSVTGITGTDFFAIAPGGKTSIGFTAAKSTDLGDIYVANGVLSSDTPTTNGIIINSNIGGGTGKQSDETIFTGSGIIYNNGQSNRFTNGGNGLNATGSLPYGGGGGTPLIVDNSADTFSGSVVSLNNVGGSSGTQVSNNYLSTYLPGNQSSAGYGTTQTPGFGSGGGGAGLFWQYNSSDYFGNGGDGGDGLLIVTFTYP